MSSRFENRNHLYSRQLQENKSSFNRRSFTTTNPGAVGKTKGNAQKALTIIHRDSLSSVTSSTSTSTSSSSGKPVSCRPADSGRSWAEIAATPAKPQPRPPASPKTQRSVRWSREVVQYERLPIAKVTSSIALQPVTSSVKLLMTKDEVATALPLYFEQLNENINLAMSQSLAESLKQHGDRRPTALSKEEVVVGDFVVVNSELVFDKEEYLQRCVVPIPPIDKKEQIKYLLEGFRFAPVSRWADAYGNFPFKISAHYKANLTAVLSKTETIAHTNSAVRDALTRVLSPSTLCIFP
jgi:hypothetical protein